MFIEFCIYFMAIGFLNIFFIIITSDTRGFKPEYASRMRALNTICVEYVGPFYALASLFIIPAVIMGV